MGKSASSSRPWSETHPFLSLFYVYYLETCSSDWNRAVTRSILTDHRMPIDYSKWDKLEVSSSEDEDEDQHNPTSSTPRVTRLDAPSKVTFGGGSVSASVSASQEPPTEASPPLRLDAPDRSNALGGASKSRSHSWTDHGGLLETKS